MHSSRHLSPQAAVAAAEADLLSWASSAPSPTTTTSRSCCCASLSTSYLSTAAAAYVAAAAVASAAFFCSCFIAFKLWQWLFSDPARWY